MYLPKSEQEIEIIRAMMNHPERDWTLPEIAEETNISKTTVWRAVNRLEDKRFVDKEIKGNTAIVKVKNREVLQRILERSFPEIEVMEAAARDFCQQVGELKGIEKCILFGSVARGTADLNSDIDILVILDSDAIDRKQSEREQVENEITMIANKLGDKRSVNLMPDVIEAKRWDKMKQHEDSFAQSVHKEGKILYEREEEVENNESTYKRR